MLTYISNALPILELYTTILNRDLKSRLFNGAPDKIEMVQRVYTRQLFKGRCGVKYISYSERFITLVCNHYN